jgi:N-acetylglucosaminyldiphosphoundecaprenol N-acetyl-beta-D-mannosaminyltransferase
MAYSVQQQRFVPDPAAAHFPVLGVHVSAVQIPEVIRQVQAWIHARSYGHFVAVTGMHGIMEAQNDPRFMLILNAASLVVVDGMPLVWLGRWRGFPLHRRVYGPELLAEFCAQTSSLGFRHFFYGGKPGVPEELVNRLRSRLPALQVAGVYSPPFRSLTEEEDRNLVALINESRADIVWVGLSTPKQEKWMYEHKEKLRVPVLIGVGAAFDFHSGRVKQAPRWMRDHGLEWLFRLSTEPRRLWRRYILLGSRFVWLVTLELSGLRRFR